jgi:hypothetical protein
MVQINYVCGKLRFHRERKGKSLAMARSKHGDSAAWL